MIAYSYYTGGSAGSLDMQPSNEIHDLKTDNFGNWYPLIQLKTQLFISLTLLHYERRELYVLAILSAKGLRKII